MLLMKTAGLFVLTAIAEIVGCFLPYLWLRKEGSVWLLLPAALSLGLFVWLLTLHPAASGRVYAAYGALLSHSLGSYNEPHLRLVFVRVWRRRI